VTFIRRRFARDNYLYLLAEGEDAVLVDPADPAVALDAARSAGVRPRWIVHTHGHADHSGGSARLGEELGAEVIGHRDDGDWFAPDRDLSGTAVLELGRLRIRVHPAPGHTPGSVLLEWRGRLLTGDTLFWSGCGNCRHGGDPALLAATFRTVLPPLDTRLEATTTPRPTSRSSSTGNRATRPRRGAFPPYGRPGPPGSSRRRPSSARSSS
jgi:hydroxyacylglutathione hydrolase